MKWGCSETTPGERKKKGKGEGKIEGKNFDIWVWSKSRAILLGKK